LQSAAELYAIGKRPDANVLDGRAQASRSVASQPPVSAFVLLKHGREAPFVASTDGAVLRGIGARQR